MKSRRLADELQLLIRRHGVDAVTLELRRLEADPPIEQPARGNQTRARPRNGRVTAPEYVRKMDIDSTRRAAVFALADRFEAKSFLPSCADISNFCTIYGIEEPASKSRAAAIPRLFKYLAAMDASEVDDLVANDAFSGPSQLGPLAEAIRRHGRAGRNLRGKADEDDVSAGQAATVERPLSRSRNDGRPAEP